MGVRICYLASRASPEELVEATNLALGESTAEQPYGEWWIARLKRGGWTILWSENERFGQRSTEQVAELSKRYETYICEVNETVMWSSAEFWKEGQQIWKVTHAGEGEDVFDLSVSGALPEGFSDLKQMHTSNQENEDEGVDHIFEIPLDLAASDCGFRHDGYLEQSEVESFVTILAPKKKGLLSRILGH